jgi:hypothetical protein
MLSLNGTKNKIHGQTLKKIKFMIGVCDYILITSDKLQSKFL